VIQASAVLPRRAGTALAAILALLLGGLLLAGSLRLTQALRTQGMLAVQLGAPHDAELARLPLLAAAAGQPRLVTLHLRNSTATLQAVFRGLDYDLAERGAGAEVPRVYVSALPQDFDAPQAAGRRKSLFLRAVLPLVLKENERLARNRARLLAIRARLEAGAAPGPEESEWLGELGARYGVAPGDLAALLRRVDVVPPSLALAQAATESAWGTSRFVREGNALFGMWTWSEEDPGLVPRERDDDARHRVRAFDSLEASVRAYMRTLNTHWAYAEFRDRRAALRRAGRHLSGLALSGGVSRYSERREKYIGELRSLIRNNELQRLDAAALGGGWNASTAAAQTTLLGGPALIAQEPGR
jgi:Bax protein